MKNRRPGTVAIGVGVLNTRDGGVTLRVARGKRDARDIVISHDALLGFGGPNHTADAVDLVRAVVAEVQQALVSLQTDPTVTVSC